MNRKIILAAGFALASSTVLAGGTNPPGPGVQAVGSTTSTQSLANAAGGNISAAITNAGGAAGLATAISNMQGATVNGTTVTSPPLSMGGTTVTVTVDTATGSVVVRNAEGGVVYSGKGE